MNTPADTQPLPARAPPTATPVAHAAWPAPAGSFFTTPAWWRATIDAALPPGATPLFLRAGNAVFPMLRTRAGWQSLTTLYSYLYEPIGIGGGADFARWCKGKGVVRLDSLDPAAPWLAELRAALEHAGFKPLFFDHFGIWEEDVTGHTWDDYARGREGRLRETLRRRLRDFHADETMRLTLDTSETAIEAYHTVERQSWKQPEPFPAFNRTLFAQAGRDGHLFLGVLWQAGAPVAVQAWALHNRRATVLKLAHDQGLDARSPGTVLTALVIRDLLDRQAIDWLDFGRGDDAYKKLWVKQRRQRVGLLIADPWRPSGWRAIARQALGRMKRSLAPSP
jgi:hypothetical protein